MLFVIVLGLSVCSITSCKKKCGYCQTSCPNNGGGTGGAGNVVTNGATVCDDDGGVAAALSNAQQECAQLNGTAGCSTSWISK